MNPPFINGGPHHTDHSTASGSVGCASGQIHRRTFLGLVLRASVTVTTVAGALVAFEPSAFAGPTCDFDKIYISGCNTYGQYGGGCIGFCSNTESYCAFGPSPVDTCYVDCTSFYCVYARAVGACNTYTHQGYCCAQFC